MTESIFFPIMISSPVFTPSFFYSLADAMHEFDTPEGVKIKRVRDASDALTNHVLWQVRKKNGDPDIKNPYIVDEDISLMQIVFETEKSLIHQELLWLEEQILEFVRGYEISMALYLFYHLDENTFKALNIAKVHADGGVKIYEDAIEDDMGELYKLASFLDALWYQPGSDLIVEKFPDLTAKFFLLFG